MGGKDANRAGVQGRAPGNSTSTERKANAGAVATAVPATGGTGADTNGPSVNRLDKLGTRAGGIKHRSAKAKGTRLERRVARRMGGTRTPLSGATGGGDISGTRFSVECKARASIPALITQAFAQAERDIAVGDTRPPLVVLQADRGKPVACLYLDDLMGIIEEGGTENAWKVKEKLRSAMKLLKEAVALAN